MTGQWGKVKEVLLLVYIKLLRINLSGSVAFASISVYFEDVCCYGNSIYLICLEMFIKIFLITVFLAVL
jgi:hypothetical protein